MGTWYNEQTDVEHEYEAPSLELTVTDNPVVAELYRPNGEVIAQVRERPPIGFR